MPGIPCLYRGPSGIYAVCLILPKRLPETIGRTEIHTSTGLSNPGAAKVADLKIQLYWRERFLTMVQPKTKNDGGLVSIADAASSLGVSVSALAGELHQDRAPAYISIQSSPRWEVPDLSDIERDHDGTFVLS
jgi:hypothetical protein